jgi:chaperonin GroES
MLKKVKPAGHRVLIKPDVTEEKTQGGIILPGDKSRADQAQVIGTIVAIGPTAWNIHGDAWAKVGDRVMFAKFAGVELIIEGDRHRVLNDEEVLAIVEEV